MSTKVQCYILNPPFPTNFQPLCTWWHWIWGPVWHFSLDRISNVLLTGLLSWQIFSPLLFIRLTKDQRKSFSTKKGSPAALYKALNEIVRKTLIKLWTVLIPQLQREKIIVGLHFQFSTSHCRWHLISVSIALERKHISNILVASPLFQIGT